METDEEEAENVESPGPLSTKQLHNEDVTAILPNLQAKVDYRGGLILQFLLAFLMNY